VQTYSARYSYAGESWLQQVKPEIIVAAPASKFETTAKVGKAQIIPFSTPEKKHRKKSKAQLKNDA